MAQAGLPGFCRMNLVTTGLLLSVQWGRLWAGAAREEVRRTRTPSQSHTPDFGVPTELCPLAQQFLPEHILDRGFLSFCNPFAFHLSENYSISDLPIILFLFGFFFSFTFRDLKESEVAQLCPTLETPWTVALQTPPSMGFSRREYWSGVSLPSLLVSLGRFISLLFP